MAEWKNSRQRSLFATLDEEKKCSKCGEVKVVDQFYMKTRRDSRTLQNYCKSCANKKRCEWVKKSKLPGYVSREETRRHSRQEKEKLKNIDQLIREIPPPTHWEVIALQEFQKLANRSRRRQRDCWTRKADSVLIGLHNRLIRNTNRDKRRKGITVTWADASKKQFRLLKCRTTLRLATGWSRKATQAVAGHKWRSESEDH